MLFFHFENKELYLFENNVVFTYEGSLLLSRVKIAAGRNKWAIIVEDWKVNDT